MVDHIKCCSCKKCWDSIEEILNDRDLILFGYQPYPKDPENGFLLFLHDVDDCGTTVSFNVKDFKEFFNCTDSFEAYTLGQHAGCKGKCLRTDDISRCETEGCKGAVVREFIAKVKEASVEKDSSDKK